ncbi:MAG: PQQ-dependent sugar dehydrogenase, partial [Rhodopirellula sp.]|nr:PQQ-dependent sugar dehydrogenase [Rhodopirellula sp.]
MAKVASRRVDFSKLVLIITVFSLTITKAERLFAADKPRPAWTTSKITGTPTPPAPYAIRPAFPGLSFAKPTSLEELPGGRILVSEIGGNIYTFRKASQGQQKDLLLTVDGASIWHATAHRQSKSRWELFVCYSKEGTTHVSRFQVAGETPVADPQTEEIILTWPAGGHNAGCLQFGTDGMLYISTGDGSGPNPPDGRTAAQDVSNLFGCILRIDIRKKDEGKNYSVPPDNPFVDLDGARPEIWSYGLRNPWKFGIDRKTGNIFAADNGWESWEMVHRIVRGGNCGWPIMEGRAVLRSEVKQGPTPIRPPVKDHSHTEANSVIGGPVYRGSQLPDLDGTFIYGDYITGTIRGLKSDGQDSYTHQVLVDTDQRITAFAEGSKGELFVLDYDYTGQIYEIVPSGLEDNSANFPRQLSETGLFSSLKSMTPSPGVVPYEVIVNRWMDGAAAQRWVAIPDSARITLANGESSASYPEGTVFVKHVAMPEADPNKSPLPLETQLLHYENGNWHPYSYVWNDEKTDATLVASAGADRQIEYTVGSTNRLVSAERTWHVSADNECRMCHNAGSGFVLGFVSNQLNRTLSASDQKFVSQLESLTRQGVTQNTQLPLEDSPARLVDPHDESQPLNDRARSYLHGNCSSCHHPGGNAIVSFYLRRELPFDELKTNKGTGIGTFGLRNAKLIVPGDPYRSVLLYRMSKLGYARMPYIGSRVVDSQGVSLIEKWIRSMPHDASEHDSGPVQNESKDHKAIADVASKGGSGSSLNHQDSVAQLLKSTAGALALSVTMHRGKATSVSSSQAYETSNSDIRGLFETFIPEKARRKTLGRNVDPQTVLTLEGNASRGKLIFYSDGARCRNCHDLDDAAKSTGPTLIEIRKKYPRRSEMLTHILKPSLKVDEKFATWSVVTNDGKIHNGLLVSQDDDAVILKTAERKTVRIATSEIDVINKSPLSLMPEGILSDQTAQEAAD